MSARLQRNKHLLQVLAKSKPNVVKSVIKSADRDLIDTLCECCLNVLNGNVPLAPPQKRKLCKYKTVLRTLAYKKQASQQKKKRSLLQKGGFLPALLAPALAGFLAGNLIK